MSLAAGERNRLTRNGLLSMLIMIIEAGIVLLLQAVSMRYHEHDNQKIESMIYPTAWA